MSIYSKIDECLESQRAVTRTLEELAQGETLPRSVRDRLQRVARVFKENEKTLDEVLSQLLNPSVNIPLHVTECVERLDQTELRRLEDALARSGLHAPSQWTQADVVDAVEKEVCQLSSQQQDALRPFLCPKPLFHVRDADVDLPPKERFHACWTVAIFPDAPASLLCSDWHPGKWAVYFEGAPPSLRNYGQWNETLAGAVTTFWPEWLK